MAHLGYRRHPFESPDLRDELANHDLVVAPALELVRLKPASWTASHQRGQ